MWWGTASALLHLAHIETYPILDVRALRSAGIDDEQYHKLQRSFEFWWRHTQFCRKVATECGVDMRTLDRALWRYDYENQKASPRA